MPRFVLVLMPGSYLHQQLCRLPAPLLLEVLGEDLELSEALRAQGPSDDSTALRCPSAGTSHGAVAVAGPRATGVLGMQKQQQG